MKQRVWDDCGKVRSATLEGKDDKTKYNLSVDASTYGTERVYYRSVSLRCCILYVGGEGELYRLDPTDSVVVFMIDPFV